MKYFVLTATLLSCSFAYAEESLYRFEVSVKSELPTGNVPLDPMVDFGSLIRDAGLTGTLDPNSIRVIDLENGKTVEHTLSADFNYGDRGRVEWVAKDPSHRLYEIQFRTASRRPPVKPLEHYPLIGTGDLLRHNAGEPRSITAYEAVGLTDLNGDGRADLVGCWSYAYRPGEPWNGIICYPRVGAVERFEFGDLTRLRYIDKPGETPKHYQHTYMSCDFADFNGDGLVDLVWTRLRSGTAEIYLNTGERDASGMPRFASAGSVPVDGWKACRAADLDGDGACDLIVNGRYIKNLNPEGWPFKPDEPVALDAGREPCFVDLDGDGRLDSVCLHDEDLTRAFDNPLIAPHLDHVRIVWRRNLGGNPPTFAPPQPLPGVDALGCMMVSAARDAEKTLLLVQHDYLRKISVFELIDGSDNGPRFRPRGRADSTAAVLALGGQAWPYPCDWDDDGDLDLLVGGGYGWPRILINQGTTARPVYADPRLIEADGRPIRFLRNEILGGPPHWHNMGYHYPSFIDWDDDKLPDLVFPNETNRIFWYKNIGTKKQPRFGPRRQILVEGFADSSEARAISSQKALKDTYPKEKERPFSWRTGAALADFNGDGLTDLVTLDGEHRRATLFSQSRGDDGDLRLKMIGPLKLNDGRMINDSIVGRRRHWTESFRAVDWDADGLIDLVYSLASGDRSTQDGGSIYLLRNCGSKSKPVFEPPKTFRCFGEPIRITKHGPHVWPGDFDGDGRPDLLACVEYSVYPFYRHAVLTMKNRPEIEFSKLESAQP